MDRVGQLISSLIWGLVYTVKCARNYPHKHIMLSLDVKLLKWKYGDYSNTEQIKPLHVAKEIDTTLCHQKLLPGIKTSALRSIIFHLPVKNIYTNIPVRVCLNWQIGLTFSKAVETGKWRINIVSKKWNCRLLHSSQQSPKWQFKKAWGLSKKQPASHRIALASTCCWREVWTSCTDIPDHFHTTI